VTADAARSAALARLTDPTAIVLFDGAMGTELYARGVFINQCYDELCLRSPELVRGVHAAYAAAGAEVVETNTFGANRLKLATYGLEEQVVAVNRRGAELAREAADAAGRPDRVVLVAGAVGPLGVRIEPYGPTSRDEARSLFREQIAALRAGGADCVVLETFGDLIEIEQAIRAARDVDPAMPVVAQMTVNADLRTPYGATPADVARALDAWGADVIGLNCSVGPQTILEAIEQMAAVTEHKLSAMPNAGMPREVGGRHMYMASAEYFATYARHLVQGGATSWAAAAGRRPSTSARCGARCAWSARCGGRRSARAHAERGDAAGARPREARRRRTRSRHRIAGRRDARAARRAVAAGREARRGRVRDLGRDVPPRGSTRPSCSPTRPRSTAPRRRHQRPRRPARAEPHGGASPRRCSSSSGWGSRRSRTTPAATATCSAC
jgi:methionine synthase I (cobalamin-dependent)